MYPGMPVSSSLNTDIESLGISATLRVSRLIELWAKATKGTAKKARTINAKIFFIIYFPPIHKYAGTPPGTLFYGIAHLNTAECSATVVPAEKLEPGRIFLSNFRTKHKSAQREGTRTEGSNRYGGV